MRRAWGLSCPWCATIVLLLLSAGGCGPVAPPAPAVQGPTPAVKDQTRSLWEPSGSEYLRDFLVCGPFVEPAPAQAASQPATAPTGAQPAAPADYLAAAGGQANVRPQEGQTVTRADGTVLTWKPYSWKLDLIDVRRPCPAAREKPCVVYAYATIRRDCPGRAIVSLTSRPPATVYVNGRVVIGPKDMAARPTVPLTQGDNAVLVRLDGGGDRWTFTLGIKEQVDTPTDSPSLLSAEIVSPESNQGELTVKVDNTNRLAPPTVTLEVLAPAGKVVARAEVPLKQTHTFATADWPDGPYEIRTVARTAEGKPIIDETLWYKGDWREGVEAVFKEAEQLPADSDDPVVLKKRLAADILRFRLKEQETVSEGTTQPAAGPDIGKILVTLLEYHEAEPLEKSPAAANGFYRLAWRDEVDGSPQFARLYLPRSYDPAKKYPMVVSLHGYNSRNPEYADDDPGTRHRALTEKYGVFRLEPHGRGNTGYQGIGEADVMRAVAEARKRFSIDDDRVYLRGQSMGAGGVWHVGTRHTDVFAALGPVSGGWDYHGYATPEEVAAWPPRQLALEEADSSFAQAECLADTPIFINMGDQDNTDRVECSRYAVRLLQRWGYEVRYWEHPGKGHTGWSADDELTEWFLTKRLCRNPLHVRLRAPTLQGANAHWVHAEQQEDPFAFMLADATVTSGDTIVLWTQNVLQLRLNPAKELLDSAKPFRVIWNGLEAKDPQVTADGQIVIRAEGYTPGRLFKKPMGPTPFAIVVGTTSKDQRMRGFCQFLAERARDDWKEWQHVTPRYFTDTEITDEQIRKYSLVLVGGPQDNAVTAKLIKDLPLTIEPQRITIDGRAFEVADAAVRMVYPHPLNADREVTILAANSTDAMFGADRLSEDADFVIDEGRVTADKDYFRTIVAWGRFDHSWRLNDKYLTEGDPSARASFARHKAPTRLSVAIADPRVMLSEVLESQSKGSFRKMVRDRNWRGKPIVLAGRTYAKGIGAACWDEQCVASYDLTGGNWKRLRATIGLEVEPRPPATQGGQGTPPKIVFQVRGDGKSLYKSPPFGAGSGPVTINVDVRGVAKLELEVSGDGSETVASVDWADVRLEK